MNFSKCPTTTTAEKKHIEKKEILRNDLHTVNEKSIIRNNKNNKNNNRETKLDTKKSKIPRPEIYKNRKKDRSSTRDNNFATFASTTAQVKRKNERKKNKILKKEEISNLQLNAKKNSLVKKCIKKKSCERLHLNKLESLTHKEKNCSKNSSTIKKMSAPLLNINKKEDFEIEIEKIKETLSFLCNTSTDLSDTLKTLKNCASLHPQALEKKKRKIQLAIKKVKSLNFAKTINVIEEAKQIIAERELLRTQIESLVNPINIKLQENEFKFEQQSALKKKDKKNLKEKIGATGDSTKLQNDLKTDIKKVNSNIVSNKTEKPEEEKKKDLNITTSKEVNQNFKEVVKKEPEKVKKDSSTETFTENSSKLIEILTSKLEKKTETITHLNCKLFELHKGFEDYSIKYNNLQIKLAELCKNLEWNYILWKEIGKLKNQIKTLEQNNKGLEEEKKELELNKKKLDEEIINLTKLNYVFSQKFCYDIPEKLNFCTCEIEEEVVDIYEKSSGVFQGIEEKVLEEKQKVIHQLLSIVRMMSDQENIAHKHKAEFLAKLQELQNIPNT